MARLSLEQIKDLTVRVLIASKTSPGNAASVAAALVAAEADGQAGHGLSRLPYYADQAMVGKVDGFAVPKAEVTAEAAVRVEARDGFAYPAIDLGIEHVVAMVEKAGVVALAISGSHHFGVAGFHVEPLADRGLLALAFSNSPAAIAPWGGARALFGTNPVAMACPRAQGPSLVIDMSLSKVARGKINLAAGQGRVHTGRLGAGLGGKADHRRRRRHGRHHGAGRRGQGGGAGAPGGDPGRRPHRVQLRF